MAPTIQKHVTVFAVFAEGALLCEQDNRPTLTAPGSSAASRTWNVTSVEDLSGQPHFWITIPDPSVTSIAQLNWSGIDYQDWELGRTGKVNIECRTATGDVDTITVELVVRSIDAKDLSFFTPTSSHRIAVCAPSPWGDYSFNIEHPTVGIVQLADKKVGDALDLSLSPSNPAGLFDAPVDSWVTLQITVEGRTARFRLRIAIRPLRIEDTQKLPCEEDLELVYGQPVKLSIEGEPSIPNGFVWSLENVDTDNFKLTPSFAPLGRGASAVLDLQGVSDWDWINGTRGGKADLVIKDGRRQEARCTLRFDLERSTRRFTLAADTELKGPDGQILQVDTDGEYLPVGMTGEPDAQILLEGVTVRSKDAGAAANLPAESVFTFVEDQPLLGNAFVQADGLTLGAHDETDDSLRDRVRVLWADPPAHGNRSHVLQIAWQVPGVDRAFIYPPFALDGLDGLGKVGVALVAPGHRAGVKRDSSLADEVRTQLATQGSFTADYAILEVDDRGALDADGKGACQVDLEIQLRLDDEANWKWSAVQNLVLAGLPDDQTLEVFHDPADLDKARQVRSALGGIVKGDVLHVLGQTVTVLEVDEYDFTIHLAGPMTDEDGNAFDPAKVVGARIYPECPIQTKIEAALKYVFDHLGTSEAVKSLPELPWQRRYPLTTFIYPDELRVAEVTNRIMDIDGIADMRILWPEANITPPHNEAEDGPTGARLYKAYILSLRRLALGPLRPTPGVDAASGYPGP